MATRSSRIISLLNNLPGRFTPREGILIAVCVLVFLGLTLDRLTSPALVWDNLGDEYVGAQWAEHLRETGRLRRDFFQGYGLHHGRIRSYLMMLPFLLLEPSYAFVKLWPVLFGLAALLAMYAFVRKVFDPATALLSLALIVVHPSFISGIRTGPRHDATTVFFFAASLYGLARWWMHGSKKSLAAGVFLASFGLGTRLWYGWYFGGLILTMLAFRKDLARKVGAAGPAERTRTIGTAAAAFLIGCLPLIWHEIRTDFASLREIFGHYGSTPGHGAFTLVERIQVTAMSFFKFLSGRWAFDNQFFGLPYLENPLYPAIFSAAFLFAGGLFLLRLTRKTARSGSASADEFFRRWMFLWTLCLGMLLVAAAFPSGKSPSLKPYFFIFYPLPQILIAVAVVHAGRRGRRKGAFVSAVAVGLLFGGEIPALAAYHHHVRAFGGFGEFAESMRDLAGWLNRRADDSTAVLVTDHGLHDNVYFWNPRLPLVRSGLPMIPLFDYQRSGFILALRNWQVDWRASAYRRKPPPPSSHDLPPIVLNPETAFFPAWEKSVEENRWSRLFIVRYARLNAGSLLFDLIASWAVQREKSFRLAARFFGADGAAMIEVFELRPFEPADPSPLKRQALNAALTPPFHYDPVAPLFGKPVAPQAAAGFENN
jgi:hypothetical protein